MARAYFFMAFVGAVSPREGWGKVKEAATRAVQKDEGLPEGHGALGLAKLHYDWDFVGAEQEFKRALELNPNNADIRHDYAHYLMAMGRVVESENESKRAVELDPMGDVLNSCLCWHSFSRVTTTVLPGWRRSSRMIHGISQFSDGTTSKNECRSGRSRNSREQSSLQREFLPSSLSTSRHWVTRTLWLAIAKKRKESCKPSPIARRNPMSRPLTWP